MSKKTTKGFSYFISLVCFIALFVFGLSTLLGAVGISWSVLGLLSSIASLIINCCVIYFAYFAIKGKGKVWLIIYIVCAVLAVCGGVVGIVR